VHFRVAQSNRDGKRSHGVKVMGRKTVMAVLGWLLASCLCLLGGCALLSDYDRGYHAAESDARSARMNFGACAAPMAAMAVMMPGHVSADKSEEWRKGYADGMKHEFKDFPTPPNLPQ
jgi:hypothetical protein